MCNAALSCSTVMLSNPLEIPGLGGIRNMVCGDGVPSGSWLIVFSVFFSRLCTHVDSSPRCYLALATN